MSKIKCIIFSFFIMTSLIAENNIETTKKTINEKIKQTTKWIKNHKKTSVAILASSAICCRGFYKMRAINGNWKQYIVTSPLEGLLDCLNLVYKANQGLSPLLKKLDNFNVKIWEKLAF
ncbi:hypothetical protein M1446_03575 [Candidatus Dependentiae bacterium]|nr:hypothetical protein [Candidatus Dependentiae bacterium]